MLSFSSYFSAGYLGLYLPATLALYAVVPQRGRRAVLLVFSYLCFWAVSGKLIVYLLLSTLSIHHLGLWLANLQDWCARAVETAQTGEMRRAVRTAARDRQRQVVALGVALHIGILVWLKYSPFLAVNFSHLLTLLHLPWVVEPPAFALPIGISFFSLQALSYVLDVYWKKIPADRNLIRLALYLSFFPQIMEGPICRYEQTAHQLWQAPALRHENLVLGLQRAGYGLMKKMILADRLNLFIKTVFDRHESCDGLLIAAGAICYTVQLYMDFSGTMDLALGTGQIFGLQLPENFQRPFRARTIPEFWQRWHISLGTWFRDYLFYPLSLSTPTKRWTSRARRRLGNHFGPMATSSTALLCVWTCNGLWHGAAWNYIFFGLYHFALIFAGNLVAPLGATLTRRLHVSRTGTPYRCLQRLRTALLVCVGELIFRANGLQAALSMLDRMVRTFSLSPLSVQRLFSLGMDGQDWAITATMLAVVAVVSALQERGIPVGQRLAGLGWLPRAALWYAMILAVVVFGAYGGGYVPVDPIYAQF